MRADLSAWQPLWDLASVLFVLGIASALNCRDRVSWWLSQGLLVLSIAIGFAAASAIHPDVDLFSLGIWIPIACVISLIGALRIPQFLLTSRTKHD